MRPLLYLHVGYPKTGTSAIQATLYANLARLREHSILYPRAAVALPAKGHHNLPRSLTQVKGIPHHLHRSEVGGFPEVLAEIHAAGCRKVIVSSEGFNHVCRTNPLLFQAVIAEHFGGLDTCIVVFVRRADDYLESKFLQTLRDWGQDRRDHPTPKLDDYIEGILAQPTDHLRTVFNLMDLPFDLVVRMYASDSVAEMCRLADYEGPLETLPRRNRRLTLKQASLLYLLSSSDRASEARDTIRRSPRRFRKLMAFEDDRPEYRLIPPARATELLQRVQGAYGKIADRTGVPLTAEAYGQYETVALNADAFTESERRSVEQFFGFGLSSLR